MVPGPQTRFGITPGFPRPRRSYIRLRLWDQAVADLERAFAWAHSDVALQWGVVATLRRMSDSSAPGNSAAGSYSCGGRRVRPVHWPGGTRICIRGSAERAASRRNRVQIPSQDRRFRAGRLRPSADGTEPPREASLDQGDQVGVEGTCRQSDAQDQAARGGQEVCAGHMVARPVVETNEIQRGDHGNVQVTAIRIVLKEGRQHRVGIGLPSWPPSTWRRVWGAHPGPVAGSGPDRRYCLARRLAPRRRTGRPPVAGG